MATPAAPQIRTRFYHPELDALRFLAAFGVFVFHSAQNSIFPAWLRSLPPVAALLAHALVGAGAYGVDLFFVLSSFLITQLLLREREQTGGLDVPAFYLRRILRIWPLYFFFIALAYCLTFFLPREILPGKYIAGFLLLYGNWVFVFFGAPHSVAGPLWSISLEEQFYFFWPQVVKRCSMKGVKIAAWLMLATGTVTRVILVEHTQAWEAFWYNTLARFDPIALGILLALYLRQRPAKLNPVRRVFLLFAGLASWMFSAHYASTVINWQIATIDYPSVAVGATAILFAVYNADFALLANRVLVYLGKISYGIYVYHVLAMHLAGWIFPRWKESFGIFAASWFAALGFTVIFAALSYRFLETPFLLWKDRYARVKSRPV